MNIKIKRMFPIVLLILLCLILNPTKVHAVLQSNGGTAVTKSLEAWMLEIRQMQSSGGTLGLTDGINATNLSSSNTNLDIHMEKNTEYGALILLSASSYGNPSKIADGGTTTGNSTGVVMKINKEWVAAGAGITSSSRYVNALGRYKNEYTTTYAAKRGDAILNWHGSDSSVWLYNTGTSGLLRSYSSSVFSYWGDGELPGGLEWTSRSSSFTLH